MVSGVLSGTVSVISGGKFANGAVKGAFTYLFNYKLHEAEKDLKYLESTGRKGKIVNPIERENGYYVDLGGGYRYVSELRVHGSKDKYLALNVALALPSVRIARGVIMIFKTQGFAGKLYTVEVVNDIFNESMPPVTPHGAAINIINNIRNSKK
ncbi:MAG: hypothetical protein ACNI25_12210 [Halarcobacter sp.]